MDDRGQGQGNVEWTEEDLERSIHELLYGNTSGVPQRGMHMGQGDQQQVDSGTSAMQTLSSIPTHPSPSATQTVPLVNFEFGSTGVDIEQPPPSATQTICPENVVFGGSGVPQPPSPTQTVGFEFGNTSVPQPPSPTQTVGFEFGNTSVPQPPSATQTVRRRNGVLGGSSVAHLPVLAAQTVQRGRRTQTRIPINVAMKGRQRSYKFHVDPNGKVAGLRALLVNETNNLPLDYGFFFNRDYLNEDVSFQTQGIVEGARVPKIEVMDFSANF